MPALFLNGAHQESGKRIITSNVDLYPDTDNDGMKFSSAIDFFQWFPCNIRVSTATLNTARFSFVSPAGTIYCKKGGEKSKGHILDGGYFENYGATTALEILEAALKLIREYNENNNGLKIPRIILCFSVFALGAVLMFAFVLFESYPIGTPLIGFLLVIWSTFILCSEKLSPRDLTYLIPFFKKDRN